MFTLPNIITLLRIALIPFFVAIFYLPFSGSELAAAGIFTVAALTDWLDGFLARYLDQGSAFGEFLDPVADKLMVCVVLIVLLQAQPELWLALPVAVIIGREITISALREWMAELGSRGRVSVAWPGKMKTVLQMIAIVFLILAHDEATPQWIPIIGAIGLYLAMLMTIWSMFIYIRLAWPELVRTSSKSD